MNNISKNIKQFRILANITQEKLSKSTGLSRNYVSLLESGKREPSISSLNKISKVLGVPISILLLEIDSSSNSLDEAILKAYEVAKKPVKLFR